jgi:hypothetical protein
MEQEIIYTEHYALIVSDEKIVEGSFIYETNIGEVSKVDKWYCEIVDKGVKVEPSVKVIAHRPLTDAPILEGVPFLPEFGKEDDVKKISLEMGKEFYIGGNYDFENGVRKGYNKAKETYKYTEEDLRKAIEMAITSKYEYKLEFYNQNEIIQSLQQPKRPKYFKCETEVKCTGNNNNGCFLESTGHDCGCAWVYPTIINSQGQTELKGEYSHE